MSLPLPQLKQKMMRDVLRLTLKQRKQIMYFILSQGGELTNHRDGSRINLDKLHESTVRDIAFQIERLTYVKPEDRIM